MHNADTYDVDSAVKELMPSVCAVIRRKLPDADLEFRKDVQQEAVLILITRALPALLPSYKAEKWKLPSFLRTAIRNAVNDAIRKTERVYRPVSESIEHDLARRMYIDSTLEPDEAKLIVSINGDPERFFTRRMAQVYRALMEHGNARAAAEALGMTTKAFSATVYALKRRIHQLFSSRIDESLRHAM